MSHQAQGKNKILSQFQHSLITLCVNIYVDVHVCVHVYACVSVRMQLEVKDQCQVSPSTAYSYF